MKVFEFEGQKGIIKLLFFLSARKGEVNANTILQESGIYQRVLWRSVDKLESLKLVKRRTDSSSYPPRKLICLTEKGLRVVRKMEEIESILTE